MGYLIVGVANEFNDNRYDVAIEGEVLAGVGINAELKGGNTITVPRADFDAYDFFYLNAVASTDNIETEAKSSDEVVKEVATKFGGNVGLAYKGIISMAVEGGGEWKDGKTHTTEKTVKVKVVYYTGGFVVSYNKAE